MRQDEHIHFEEIDSAVSEMEEKIETLDELVEFYAGEGDIRRVDAAVAKKQGLEEAIEILVDHGLY